MNDPIQIIFNTLSQLSGGLITDMTTATLGVIFLMFISFGFEHLMEIIEGSIQRSNSSRSLINAASSASIAFDELNSTRVLHGKKPIGDSGDFNITLANIRYRNALKRYSKADYHNN